MAHNFPAYKCGFGKWHNQHDECHCADSIVPSPELLEEARKAIERMKADTRTDQQKLDDAVAFVLDSRLGGS